MSYEEESAILGLMALGRTREQALAELRAATEARNAREHEEMFRAWMNYEM